MGDADGRRKVEVTAGIPPSCGERKRRKAEDREKIQKNEKKKERKNERGKQESVRMICW